MPHAASRSAGQYLKRRVGKARSGERFYVQVPIPADLRGRFGGLRAIERALRTGDPRIARVRRDAAVVEIRAMFDAARAAPTLDQVIAAARREELARAGAEWAELVADHGQATARRALNALLEAHVGLPDDRGERGLEPDARWLERSRRAALRHGLEPSEENVERLAEAMLEAHLEAAEVVCGNGPGGCCWMVDAAPGPPP